MGERAGVCRERGRREGCVTEAVKGAEGQEMDRRDEEEKGERSLGKSAGKNKKGKKNSGQKMIKQGVN